MDSISSRSVETLSVEKFNRNEDGETITKNRVQNLR